MKLLTFALAAALTGCAATTPMIKVEPKEVQVVVSQPYPRVEVLPHPVLDISKLKDGDSPGVVAQAYQVTVQQLLNLIAQLETQIAGINKNAR